MQKEKLSSTKRLSQLSIHLDILKKNVRQSFLYKNLPSFVHLLTLIKNMRFITQAKFSGQNKLTFEFSYAHVSREFLGHNQDICRLCNGRVNRISYPPKSIPFPMFICPESFSLLIKEQWSRGCTSPEILPRYGKREMTKEKGEKLDKIFHKNLQLGERKLEHHESV